MKFYQVEIGDKFVFVEQVLAALGHDYGSCCVYIKSSISDAADIRFSYNSLSVDVEPEAEVCCLTMSTPSIW